MASFGKRMFPMFAVAAIAILIASGVSVAQLEGDSGAGPLAANPANRCAQVHDVAAGNCTTAWQMLWGSKN